MTSASHRGQGGELTGKVLVLGHDNRSFLSVIRSLGRRGLAVHVGWTRPGSSATSSKYIAKMHDIPRFRPGESSWLDALKVIIKGERFDLVIPCGDAQILPLYLHRAELEPLARLALPNPEGYDLSFSKIRSNGVARSLGISVPNSVAVREVGDIDRALSTLQFPMVAKPEASITADHNHIKLPVRRVFSQEQLRETVEELLQYGNVLVQENFIGTGVDVEILADRGEILVAFQMIRVHEPVTGGGSIYRKSVPIEPDLLSAAAGLASATGYTGVAQVEFRRDFDSGRWVFLEVNGRFFGSLPLAMASGVDLPYYFYQLLVHGQRDFPQTYRTGIFCRNMLLDLSWMRANLRADRSDPVLQTRPLWKVAAEVANVITLREHSDTFVIDDLTPGLVELAQLWRRARHAVSNTALLAALKVPLLRSAYRSRARRALEGAERGLIVCKGNICRGPFAERRLRKLLAGRPTVASVGYHPVEGRRSPPAAVSAARSFGVDLASHRSSVVAEAAVREAGIILVFDEQDRRAMLQGFPRAAGRVFLLGAMADSGPPTIGDPYDRGAKAYRTAVQATAEALAGLCGAREVDAGGSRQGDSASRCGGHSKR